MLLWNVLHFSFPLRVVRSPPSTSKSLQTSFHFKATANPIGLLASLSPAVNSSTLQMEAAVSSETLIPINQPTRCHNHEDTNLHIHCRRKLNLTVSQNVFISNTKSQDTEKKKASFCFWWSSWLCSSGSCSISVSKWKLVQDDSAIKY